MPLFDSLIDQERPLRILTGILSRGDIPHAFLLTGTDGVGKRSTAIRFAMACNCLTLALFTAGDATDSTCRDVSDITPCGQCRACRQILGGTHPDIIFLEPEGDVIKIDTIRELLRRIAYKPYQASQRVIILSDAQALNREAANALLKALEEPPPQTIFFLTAGQSSDLLATVISRCQNIRFNPVSTEGLAMLIHRQLGITGPAAQTAALLADGSAARALELAGDSRDASGAAIQRQWIIDEIERLPSRSTPLVMAFAEKLAADKKTILRSLEIIKGYLRDALIYRYCPTKIINTDMADRIKTAAADTAPALLLKIDAVNTVEKALTRNANPRLWLEFLSLTLAGMIHEKNY